MIWRGSYGASTGASSAITSSARTISPPWLPGGCAVRTWPPPAPERHAPATSGAGQEGLCQPSSPCPPCASPPAPAEGLLQRASSQGPALLRAPSSIHLLPMVVQGLCLTNGKA